VRCEISIWPMTAWGRVSRAPTTGSIARWPDFLQAPRHDLTVDFQRSRPVENVVLRQSQKRPFCWMELSARGIIDMRSSASAGTNLRVTASPTRFFGGTMTKRNRAFFEEGTLEAVARLRNQDDEFCRRLRIAVEMGMESCPITVSTEPCTKRPISNYTRPN
jgi:hypothetical protein